jgi:hypothetical protein
MTPEERSRLEEEFNRKYAGYIRDLEETNFIKSKKMELRQMRRAIRKKAGLTTTKLLSFYLFFVCNVILLYAMIAMWHFADLSYLGVIITDIVGQILVYGIYAIRAFKDTQSEEMMRLERDKLNNLPANAREKINDIFDMMSNLTLGNDDADNTVDSSNNGEVDEASIDIQPVEDERGSEDA